MVRMELTREETYTLLESMSCLIESQCDSIDHTKLIEKLRLGLGFIKCATCHLWVLLNSEDMLNDYHVDCGSAR